jgi:hypothetical protein
MEHKGTIGVDATYGEGCRMIVTLPSFDSWGKKEVDV